jgi:hypothetical protein
MKGSKQMAEKMSDDELAYHQSLLAQLRMSQAAWSSWSAQLAQKYQLREKDSITEQGAVVRVQEA